MRGVLFARGSVLALVIPVLALLVSPALAQELAPRAAWVVDGPVNAIAPGPGGSAYIGGDFGSVGANTGGFAALEGASGVSDPAWPRFDGAVGAIVPDGSGGWFVGGGFGHVGAVERTALAHLRGDRTLDTAWDAGLTGLDGAFVSALVLDGGALYVGGNIDAAGGGSGLVAVDAGSGARLAWEAGIDGRVGALALSGRTLIAGGSFNGPPPDYDSVNFALFDLTTGARVAGPTTEGAVAALAVVGDTVYAGGDFRTFGGQSRSRLAAVDARTGAVTPWNPMADDVVFALAVAGGTVYAGGRFGYIGVTARSRLAAIDALTGALAAWSPNPDGDVLAIAPGGSVVYVGGGFASIGGAPHRHAAALDAASGAALPWAPRLNGAVGMLTVAGSVLFAGGGFDSADLVGRGRLAALDAASGAVTPWASAANHAVDALAVSGGVLYAGGRFTSIGGARRHRLAALDPRSGRARAWNPDADGPIYHLAVVGRRVFAWGGFTTIGGRQRAGIAGLDAVTGAATAWRAKARPLSGPFVAGPRGLYFGLLTRGRSELAGALDPRTGRRTRWAPAPVFRNGIDALAVSGGTVYVGGNFRRIGGRRRPALAALDPVRGRALAWNAHAGDAFVRAITIGGGVVYAGGFIHKRSLVAFDTRTGAALNWAPRLYRVPEQIDREPDQLAISGDTLYAVVDRDDEPEGPQDVLAFPLAR